MAQASPSEALMNDSRDLLRDRLCEALAGMLDKAEENLTALAEKAGENDIGKRILDGRDFALAHREAIESQFRSRYGSEFQKALNKTKGGSGGAVASFSLDDLELVGDDDLNETLKLNDTAAKLRRHCEEELGALDQRAGVLLGNPALQSEENPLGAKVVLDAYKAALRHADASVELRVVLLTLFDKDGMEAIKLGYQQVNDLLVENNILPKIRYGISKNEDKGGGASGGDKDKPKDKKDDKAAEAAPEQDDDIFATLAKMMNPGAAPGGAGAPAPGMGVGNVPLVQGPQLMGSHTDLQLGNLAALGEAAAELGPILAEAGNLKNVLHQLKQTSVGGSMGQVDAMTLDIVAMLYDELFEDPKIPVALKSLIGRLQLPMLKVAIADKELFTKKEHPARQLLDTLGQLGLRLPADFDHQSPTFKRLEAFVDDLVDNFREKMDIFDKVRAHLEAIIAEDDQRVSESMHASAVQLQQAESLALAKATAQEEIRERVEAASKPPRPVVAFLAQQWIKYLVVVHAKQGGASDAWRVALEAIDRLLWSVEPKGTQEERRKLATTIPPLLKALRAGVAEAGIDEATSAAFFQELMKCHTEVMRAPMAPPPAKEMAPAPATVGANAAPAKPGAPGKAGAAAPAKPAKAEPRDELLDFTEPVTMENPFGGGSVEVTSEDLDFTAATADAAMNASRDDAERTQPLPAMPELEGAPPPPPSPYAAFLPASAIGRKPKVPPVRLPSGMVLGCWVEIIGAAGGDDVELATLHYVSPMKSHFLFVDRKGRKVFECSRTILARRIKLGEVTLLDGEPDPPLFDRLMKGIFGKLKQPLPA